MRTLIRYILDAFPALSGVGVPGLIGDKKLRSHTVARMQRGTIQLLKPSTSTLPFDALGTPTLDFRHLLNKRASDSNSIKSPALHSSI